MVKKRALKPNQKYRYAVAYRNAGNCLYSHNFGGPRFGPFCPNGKSTPACAM